MTPHRRTMIAFEHRLERLIFDGHQPGEALELLEQQVATEALARIERAQELNTADRRALLELRDALAYVGQKASRS